MRKIYSLALLAAALLISANGWAQKAVTVTTGGVSTDYANLDEAFVAVGAEEWSVYTHRHKYATDAVVSYTIKLNDNSEWTKSYVFNKNQNITFDLNGHIATARNEYGIEGGVTANLALNGAKLFLTGPEGSKLWGKGSDACLPKGFVLLYLYGATEHPEACDYTRLIVDKDVLIQADNLYGVGLMDNAKVVWDERKNVFTYYKSAYGVKLDIYGSLVCTSSCISPNGRIQKTDGTCTPTVNIYDGASLMSTYVDPSDNSGVPAIYAAGYVMWNIGAATITGPVGIYVKAGNFNLNGTKVHATGNYQEPKPNGNGSSSNGDAIVYDSHGAYADADLVLSITGDAEITSDHGYAINEVVTTPTTTNTKVNTGDWNIESGTFKGGDGTTGGSIKTTAEVKETVKLDGAIKGGNFSDENIKDYIDNVDGVITVVKGDDGKDRYVVSDTKDATWVNTLAGATKGTYVKLEGATETVATDIEIAYLKVLKNSTVTVEKSLTVGGVILDENSKLIVKAGAKLIVLTQGIVAFNENNIVLETQEGKEAILLLSPDVTGNTHPYATVEFLSKAYYVDANTYLFQRLGVPTNNLTAITCDGAIRNRFWSFDAASNSWKDLGAINKSASDKDLNTTDLNNAFTYYQLMSYANAAGTKLYFKGSLAGNQDKEIAAKGNFWNGYANSYLAEMNIKAMLDDLAAAGIQPAIYLAQENGPHTLTWDFINATSFIVDPTLNAVISPMQAFLVKNFGANTSVTLDYKNYVWNPAMTTGKAAPARRKVASDITSAKIVITNTIGAEDKVLVVESSRFSSDYDMEYDAVKYMNEDLNLYVTTAENNLSIMTTDNIENTYLGFTCVAGGKYAIRFSNINGAEMVLTDMETGATIVMAEGQTYEFEAGANTTNDYRFRITKRQNVTTGVENAVINAQETGIYSITGQYLGEVSQWNNMPSGMYIVNGEKKIK